MRWCIVCALGSKEVTVEQRYYSINEVADLFGVTRKAVYNWMGDGRLEYEVIGARRRITQTALDAFIASGKQRTSETAEKNEAPGLIVPAYAIA